MCGIDGVELRLEPELVCDADDLDTLMNVDALVITLPARRSGPGESFYLQAMQEIVDSALAHHVPRIIFTSSTSVYGEVEGVVKETSERRPVTASGQVLKELEDWLHHLPGTQVDIVRLAGLVGPGRHPGRFFAGKTARLETASMLSILCILMMWLARLSYSYRLRKAGTSTTCALRNTRHATAFTRACRSS